MNISANDIGKKIIFTIKGDRTKGQYKGELTNIIIHQGGIQEVTVKVFGNEIIISEDQIKSIK